MASDVSVFCVPYSDFCVGTILPGLAYEDLKANGMHHLFILFLRQIGLVSHISSESASSDRQVALSLRSVTVVVFR